MVYGQESSYHLGASSSGMSEANINSSNAWAVFNNPAATTYLNHPEAVVSYQNRYNLPAFQTVGGGVVYPLSKITPSLSFFRFGDDAYSNQKVGLSVASQLQIVSLALGIHYVQHRIDEIGTFKALMIDFGGIAEIIDGLRIGAHVINLNQAKLGNGDPVPTVMRLGISYVPANHFIITSELEKDLERPEALKFGLEYYLTDFVALRTGFNTSTKSYSFGLGFIAHDLIRLDYAFVDKNPVGIIHEISLGYRLKRP